MELTRCKYCENHVLISQEKRWEKDGVTPLNPRRFEKEPYCIHYGLHLDWIHQLHEVQGMSKCKYFEGELG